MGRSAPRALILLLIAVLSIGLLAACGDDDEGGSGETTTAATTTATTSEEPAETTGQAPAGGPTVLEIPADETDLAFQKTEVTAPAGEVTLRMPNPSAVPHNIAVDMPTPTEGEVVQQGGVSEITVNFPAGEYEYYCSVPGHEEAGMKGTLTVE